MKTNRHSAILNIIENNSIETQEELISALDAAGYKVTQATVSRDIRELKLTKTMGERGKYKYVLPADDKNGHHAYSSALAAAVTGIEAALNHGVRSCRRCRLCGDPRCSRLRCRR